MSESQQGPEICGISSAKRYFKNVTNLHKFKTFHLHYGNMAIWLGQLCA